MPAPQLIVALDVDDLDKALRLRDSLGDVVNFFKVGNELFTHSGVRALEKLSGSRIFLDLKFHDIPNTVAGAVRAARRYRVAILDVHTAGGRTMMEAAAKAARDASEADDNSTPEIFGVTVLTHLGDEELMSLGLEPDVDAQVLRLARLAAEAGLDGVVASAHEVLSIREATGDRLGVLVPGVRPTWASESHDQRRVATPSAVARSGARYVVVGRAITRAVEPRDAAKRILDELH